jgi:DNA polymerase III epsilon subunit-like protein
VTELPTKGAAYSELIAGHEFVIIDIETTTVAATTSTSRVVYPISIGAVRLLNGVRRETLHTMANPGVPVDEESSKYNGITTADLAHEQNVPMMLDDLDAFLARFPEADVVCHNAYFDVRHLHEAYARAGKVGFHRRVFDTLFIPVRLKLPGVANRAALDTLRNRYSINTTVSAPKGKEKLYKGLKDAQDTAELLSWLLAEAAQSSIVTWGAFVKRAKPKTSTEIAATTRRPHRYMARPTITAKHIASCHGGALPAKPGPAALDRWVTQVTDCLHVHCPHLPEKVTCDHKHAALLIPKLTAMLPGCSNPGDLGTLLLGLEPLLTLMTKEQSRTWYKANHTHIRAGAACEPAGACPACVADQPCPKDVVYHLLSRRALDYGVTSRGVPVSLLSKRAKKDLWDGESARKIDTYPRLGIPQMVAYMLWVINREARAKRETATATKLLDKAVARNLHLEDPRLALEVARHWSNNPRRDADVEELVATVLAKATTDPGFTELELWFTGPYRRKVEARHASKVKAKPPRKRKPLRIPAEIELRPAEAQHAYRYQVHRLPDAS